MNVGSNVMPMPFSAFEIGFLVAFEALSAREDITSCPPVAAE